MHVNEYAQCLLNALLDGKDDFQWSNPDAVLRHVAMLDELIALKNKQATISLRGLYYRLAPYFDTQAQANRYLDKFVRILETTREDLGVIPAPKGFVSGALSVAGQLLDGAVIIDQEIANEATLKWVGDKVFHVLVVEKHSSFADLIPRMNPYRCLLVTGRGYPDVATRNFLSRLVICLPAKTPFYYLGDYDPHGLHIFTCYRRQAVWNFEWIGLNPDWTQNVHEKMPLTHKDNQLLDKLISGDDMAVVKIAKVMRLGSFKCEIEALDDSLSALIENKITESLKSVLT